MVTDSENRIRITPVSEGVHRPLWSVMIPTFNCAPFLRQTLESVLSQDPGPDAMQIEVVDDCSTQDDPESVVRAVAGERVRFYQQPKNVGHTRNFETCLQHARGHLAHLLHGDDAVRRGFYERMGRAFAQNTSIGAAFCRHITMDADGNWLDIARLERSQSGLLPDLVERLAVHQRIQTPAMVVRREVYEALGGFDRRLSWTEDWEMWMRIAAHYPVWYETEPLALYRVHANSNTGRYVRSGESSRDLKRLFSIIEHHIPGTRGQQLTRCGREWSAISALETARGMFVTRNFLGASTQIWGALRLSHRVKVVAASLGLVAWVVGRGLAHLLRRMLPFNRVAGDIK